MKTINKFKAVVLILMLSIGFSSCEDPQLNDGTESMIEEGFKSTTRNSDTKSEELEVFKDTEVVFQATYDDTKMTEQEASEKFERDSEAFMVEYRKNNRGVSTEWFWNANIKTGYQTHNQTTGRVSMYARFSTSTGTINTRVTLTGCGRRGGFSYYLLKTTNPGPAISWIRPRCAQMALRGTDAWFLTHINIVMKPNTQSVSASGAAYLNKSPNVWLDSSSSTGWDTYWTCSGTNGTLYF